MLQSELKAKIRRGEVGGLFIFSGEEDYLKNHYLKLFREKILTDDAFSTFNHMQFSGEKIDFPALCEAVQSPPFMSEGKLIEWHYPYIDSFKDKEVSEFETLSELCEDNGFATVIFICEESGFDVGRLPKKPSKLYTQLCDFATIVDFEHSDDAHLSDWICAHAEKEGLNISREVCMQIIEKSGRSMDVLSLELDKLFCYAKANNRSEINAQDTAAVTSASFEGDAFGLTNSILSHDARAAYADLKDKKMKKSDSTVVLGSVFRLFSNMLTVFELSKEGLTQAEIAKKTRIHEYKAGLYLRAASSMGDSKLNRALALCREIDQSAKNGGSDGYAGLERLIFEIMSEG